MPLKSITSIEMPGHSLLIIGEKGGERKELQLRNMCNVTRFFSEHLICFFRRVCDAAIDGKLDRHGLKEEYDKFLEFKYTILGSGIKVEGVERSYDMLSIKDGKLYQLSRNMELVCKLEEIRSVSSDVGDNFIINVTKPAGAEYDTYSNVVVKCQKIYQPFRGAFSSDQCARFLQLILKENRIKISYIVN